MVSIKIPEGVKAEINGNLVKVTGSLGTNERKFNDGLMQVKIENGELVIIKTNYKKLDKKASNVIAAFTKEITNDFKGVNEYFETNMEAVFSHFPITLEVQGKNLIIKNMLG